MIPATAPHAIRGLEVVVCDKESQILALKPEWDALLDLAFDSSGAQGCAYVLAAWRALPKSPETRLAVITVRRDGRLVALWPLQVFREGKLTIACHLGCGANEEYAGPLLTDAPSDVEAVAALVTRAKSLADVLRVYNVPARSAAAAILRADRNFRRYGWTDSPILSSMGCDTAEQWLADLSKGRRTRLRRDRKVLAAQGEYRFQRMAGPVDGPTCVAWIFDHKRKRLEDTGARRTWVLKDQGPELFTTLASAPARPGRTDDFEAYAITLDGRILTACIILNSPCRMEAVISAYDATVTGVSLGDLLVEERVRLAIQRRQNFDLRITHEAWKLRWTDAFDRFESFMIACSPRGRIFIAREIVTTAIHRQRVVWGPRIKGLVRGLVARFKAGKSAARPTTDRPLAA